MSRKKNVRQQLDQTRSAVTKEFAIDGHDCYVTVGLFEDGSPGEIFITMSKCGSTLHGFVDALSIALSVGLQYGVPLQTLIDKYKDMRFEPCGFTSDGEIGEAYSVVDFIFRWMEKKFNVGTSPSH